MWMPALLLAAAIGDAAPSEAEANFRIRAQALAADEACDLFAEPERRFLEAGLAQARRDLTAAGLESTRIEAALSRIRADRRMAACDSEPVRAIAETARAAAVEMLRQPTFPFQGTHRTWRVDRTRYDFVRWPVLQEMDGARFGRAVSVPDPNPRDRVDARETAPAFVIAGESEATSAVLVLRDGAKAPEPYDRTLAGLLPPPDGAAIARFSAPPHGERRVFASARLSPERARRLLSEGERAEAPASGFVFPEETLGLLAALAPNEAAAIELFDARGQRLARYWIEIGHLQAALDFAALPYEGYGVR